jgi:hypothetical protein
MRRSGSGVGVGVVVALAVVLIIALAAAVVAMAVGIGVQGLEALAVGMHAGGAASVGSSRVAECWRRAGVGVSLNMFVAMMGVVVGQGRSWEGI